MVISRKKPEKYLVYCNAGNLRPTWVKIRKGDELIIGNDVFKLREGLDDFPIPDGLDSVPELLYIRDRVVCTGVGILVTRPTKKKAFEKFRELEKLEICREVLEK